VSVLGSAAEARCKVVSTLAGSWHADTLRAPDRDTYEQHLLFCPPCLVQNDKAGLAFGALRVVGAGEEPAPEALVRELMSLVAAGARGR
jgi:hypothetical protein